MFRKMMCALAVVLAGAAWARTAVVLDFDTEIRDYEGNAVIMSDMFRAELVQGGRLDVIDRKSMDAVLREMRMQNTEYMSDRNVKELGHILNADYLVTGHVMALSNHVAQEDVGVFLRTVDKITLGGSKVEVIIQLLDVETLRVLGSVRAELDRWTDFSQHTRRLARELTARLPQGGSAESQVLENMNGVTASLFTGTWSAEVSHDGVVDQYELAFGGNHSVRLRVVSIGRNGARTEAEGSGRFSFGEDTKILSVTVGVLSGNVRHLKSISWKSLVNPFDDGAFACIVPVASGARAERQRVTFYRD